MNCRWLVVLMIPICLGAFAYEFNPDISEIQILDEHEDLFWQVFAEANGPLRVFASSRPTDITEASARNQDEVFLQVVHQVDKPSWAVISMGIPVQDPEQADIVVQATIHYKRTHRSYPLYPGPSGKFLFVTPQYGHAATDQLLAKDLNQKFIEDLRRANSVTVQAYSPSGELLEDQYSLTGSQSMIDSAKVHFLNIQNQAELSVR